MCSENKGANQMFSYYSADLWLCFHICKHPVFLIMQVKGNDIYILKE